MDFLQRRTFVRPLQLCALLALAACTQRDVVMVEAERLDVTPAEASVLVGQQTQLDVTVRASGGQPLSGRTVTWSSDDPAVATADENGRVTGLATGTATIRASSEGVTGTALVTVTAGPVPAIAVNPASISIAAVQNGATPGDRTVAITNAGTGQLTGLAAAVRYESSPTGWLTAVLGSTTAPANLVLSASQAGLGPGTYRAFVDITAPGAQSSPVTVQVDLTVAGPQPAIGLGATSVSFAAPLGGASPARQNVAVTNAGGGTLSGLTATVIHAAGQPTGWLAATLGATTAPTTLELAATTGALPVGVYTATVRVSSAVAQNSPQDVQVTFTVGAPPPAIGASPSSLGFTAVTGTAAPTQQVSITNAGGGTLSGLGVSVTYPGGQPAGWVTTSLAGTTAPTTLTVGASAAGLAPGTYTASIGIASPAAANSPQVVAVTLTVTPVPAPGVPSNLVATAAGPTRIDIAWDAPTTGGPVVGYRIERRTGTGAFALVDSVGAGTRSLQQTGLTPQTTYGYRVQACNASGCSAFTAVATATTGAQPPVAEAGGPYSGVVGGSVTLDGSGSSDPDGTIVGYQWVIADEGEPTVLAGVKPTYTCTAAGSFAVTLTVTDNGGASASDGTTLTCTAAPTPRIALSPGSLTFNAASGATAPTQTVSISNAGDGTLSGLAVAVTYPDGQPSGWLTTSLAGTTAPTTLTVGASAAGLGAGTYTATVSVSSPVADNSPQLVNVTLQVTAVAGAPGAPGNITFTDVTATGLTVNWSAPVTGGTPTRYYVERRGPTGPRTNISGDLSAGTFSFADTGLAPALAYRYRVTACNADGCTASEEVSVTTLPGG